LLQKEEEEKEEGIGQQIMTQLSKGWAWCTSPCRRGNDDDDDYKKDQDKVEKKDGDDQDGKENAMKRLKKAADLVVQLGSGPEANIDAQLLEITKNDDQILADLKK